MGPLTAMLRRVLTLAAWCSAAAVAAMVTKEDSGDAAAGRITKDAEDAAGRIIVVDDVTGSTTFDFSSFITPFSLSLGSVSISSTQLILGTIVAVYGGLTAAVLTLAIILAVAAAETATKRDYWAELFGEHEDYDYNPYPLWSLRTPCCRISSRARPSTPPTRPCRSPTPPTTQAPPTPRCTTEGWCGISLATQETGPCRLFFF